MNSIGDKKLKSAKSEGSTCSDSLPVLVNTRMHSNRDNLSRGNLALAALESSEAMVRHSGSLRQPLGRMSNSDQSEGYEGDEHVEDETATDEEKKNLRLLEFRARTKDAMDSTTAQIVLVILTFFALFAGDVWVLAFTVSEDIILTVLLLVCFSFFAIELIATILVNSRFYKSIFFWMDTVALFSLLLDCTFIATILHPDDEQLIMITGNLNYELGAGLSGTSARASRAARIGTRAGRLTKVLRVLRVVRLFRLVRVFRLREKIRQLEVMDKFREEVDPEDEISRASALLKSTKSKSTKSGLTRAYRSLSLRQSPKDKEVAPADSTLTCMNPKERKESIRLQNNIQQLGSSRAVTTRIRKSFLVVAPQTTSVEPNEPNPEFADENYDTASVAEKTRRMEKLLKHRNLWTRIADATMHRVVLGILGMLLVLPLLAPSTEDNFKDGGAVSLHNVWEGSQYNYSRPLFQIAVSDYTTYQRGQGMYVLRLVACPPNATEGTSLGSDSKSQITAMGCYFHESKDTQSDQEIQLLRTAEKARFRTNTDQLIVWWSIRSETRSEAFNGILRTLFVALVMGILSYGFSKDTNRFVVEPVEAMGKRIKFLADESLCRCLIKDDKKTLELETEVLADAIEQVGAMMAKCERMLNNILPEAVIKELLLGHSVIADAYAHCTLIFTDLVGFTQLASRTSAADLVRLMNAMYSVFDTVISKHSAFKVETIGDAYLISAGCPYRDDTQHFVKAVETAIELLSVMHIIREYLKDDTLKLRVGLHSGPICAGVIGQENPRFRLFGDTVNVTSRMESNGVPGRRWSWGGSSVWCRGAFGAFYLWISFFACGAGFRSVCPLRRWFR